MTFAEKLRELRDAKGLSEAKLAEAAGLTFASVHGYGLGRRTPSFPAVVKLARALGVTCEAFADCDDVLAEGQDESTSQKRAAVPRGGRPAASRRPRGRRRTAGE